MTDATGSPRDAAPPDGLTPSQTVGPFFAYMLTPRDYDAASEIFGNGLTGVDAAGERIRLDGRILDGDGQPVADAMLEIWQADGNGRYAGGTTQPGGNTSWKGFGRTEVDAEGCFSFTTVIPGSVPGPEGGEQAPHINLGIFARGLLNRLFTRIYFEGESRNEADPILALVPADRRGTLIATRRHTGEEPVFALTIRLRGEGETVFFEA